MCFIRYVQNVCQLSFSTFCGINIAYLNHVTSCEMLIHLCSHATRRIQDLKTKIQEEYAGDDKSAHIIFRGILWH